MPKALTLISAVGLFAALGVSPVVAGEAGGIEAQAVVQRQLDAFKRGDADGAFALASPALKENFSDSGAFMEIVRAKYAPFFRRRMAEFGTLAIAGDTAAQSIVIVDEDSDVWNVVYELGRQPDGSWAVSNCLLMKSDSTDA
ncbi:MAG TPA: DUF4864 domain-containing protein [Roseiarcus sp.]|nr:DUF4864 domain-containing protein [Roseiarcus sp.]